MDFDRDTLRDKLAKLAREGVFLGTSSWKYPGWIGTLYDSERYRWRGRFSKARFERQCLAEYAEVFRTVSVDATYYGFPTAQQLREWSDSVPRDFQFGFKVPDQITVRTFPRLPRFGSRAGTGNESFLNDRLFTELFLEPCEAIRSQVGVFVFEFSRFHGQDYARGRDFVQDLDKFLGRLPGGWPYAVEIRNAKWMTSEYFECLARNRVAPVYNSWTAMPPVSEQMAAAKRAGTHGHSNRVVARLLLKPGRTYAEAVERFQPYDQVQEPLDDVRAAGRALIGEGRVQGERCKTFIFVNNRLEGNSLGTLAALVEHPL